MTKHADEEWPDGQPPESSGVNPSRTLSIVRGLSQLAGDAVVGTTSLVQSVQETVIRHLPVLGRTSTGPIRKISGWVFESIRWVSDVVDTSLQSTVERVENVVPAPERSSRRRETAIAALNGVLGDHLSATGNPLALPMSFRRKGRVFEPNADVEHEFAPSTATPERVVVLVHGLCLTDRQWTRNGHDHGAVLERDLGYTPVYLRYNSGRSIPTNGQLFADKLEGLVRGWPVPIRELSIVGHSMGGLLARSAWHHGQRANHSWCEQLTTLVCLGSPHLGTPYERIGQMVDQLLEATPYSAPFAEIGTLRSSGIKDLRHGRVQDTETPDGFWSPKQSNTLPPARQCFLLAATVAETKNAGSWLPADGLVPVNSALGQHRDGSCTLPIPDEQKVVCSGLNHFDLLSSPVVSQHLLRWLRRRPRSNR